MKLAELREQVWRDAQDRAEPHLLDADDVDAWLNEAEGEGATRADLLHESEDPQLCEIDLAPDLATYPLDARLLRVTRAMFYPIVPADADPTCNTRPRQLRIIDREELDRLEPCWRDRTELFCVIVQDSTLRLGCKAGVTGTIQLEAYRLPAAPMVSDDDTPEIAEVHHRQLVHWALSRGLSQPENELFDPKRAAAEEERFERYFGPRPTAQRMRGNENRPQFNKAWL